MNNPLHGENLGWFGKIPALGDFATRRLPPSFVEPWDEWLCSELSAAARTLAEAWESAYDRAPVVCFSMAEGIVDAQGWVGILVPSVDRVGRRFPLTIACAVPDPRVPLPGAPWWTALVAAGRQAVNPGHGLDDLEEALTRLPACGGQYVAAAVDNEPAAEVLVVTEALPRGARFREFFGLERDDSSFRRPPPRLMEN